MTLTISKHAVDRYQERVKPGLDYAPCRQELEALVRGAGRLQSDPPPGFTLTGDDPPDAYLPLSDGICALVNEQTVITVLVRGGAHASVRQGRNERKARRRRARRKPKDIGFASGGSEPKVRWR